MGEGKIVGGMIPGRPQSFRNKRRPVDDWPGRGGIQQDGVTSGATFHGELDRCR